MQQAARSNIWARAALSAALLCAAFGAARAQDAERAFFSGKTVRLVVSFGPGGGYDAYARMIAPYLSRALGASVVVENQPGAGGLVALNRIYTAPPDGLIMMIVNGTGAALAQLTEQAGVRFDLGRFGYLGTVSASKMVGLCGKKRDFTRPMAATTRCWPLAT